LPVRLHDAGVNQFLEGRQIRLAEFLSANLLPGISSRQPRTPKALPSS
jgi:hypothetical protein